jgi:adenosylhomocysteinase
VDDGGDATLFVHQGVKVEKDPSLLEKEYDNPEMQIVMDRLKASYESDPGHWTSVAQKIQVSRKKPPPV